MKKYLLPLLALLSASALAQSPTVPTKEQMQQMQLMMMQRMQMMAAMYDVKRSAKGLDETLAALKASGVKRGWKVGEVVDVQGQMQQGGAKEARPMKVLPLCPKDANERIAKASGGKAPPLPCRATAYVGQDGKVYVMRMNLHTLAKGTQGELAKVLGELAAEEDAVYHGLVE